MRWAIIATYCLGLTAWGAAETDSPEAALVSELLRQFPPERVGSPRAGESAEAATIPGDEYAGADPGPDASYEDLIQYWLYNRESEGSAPSPEIQLRLLEACEREPEHLAAALKLLPDTPEVHTRVKAVFDAAKGQSYRWEKDVRKWLMLRSVYFREELTVVALSARWDGYVVGKDAIHALVELDWDTARDVLRAHAKGRNFGDSIPISDGLKFN